MPVYEYRCRTCGDTFERLRSLDEADAPTSCTEGHDDTTRLLSLIASPTTGTTSASAGGACCGGGCCAG